MEPRRNAPRPAGPQSVAPGVLEPTRPLTVTQWLLAAAEDPNRARLEWAEQGIALLRCGTLFTAVRLAATLVHAAAGIKALDNVDTVDRLRATDAYLARTLQGGPVFLGSRWQRYYALVPADTADRPYGTGPDRAGDAQCLGICHLGVPDPLRTRPAGSGAYWCVPVSSPATLCAPDAVAQLVTDGRRRLTIEGANTGE